MEKRDEKTGRTKIRVSSRRGEPEDNRSRPEGTLMALLLPLNSLRPATHCLCPLWIPWACLKAGFKSKSS